MMMKRFVAVAAFLVSPELWSVTPEIGPTDFEALEMACPDGRDCNTLPNSFCSEENIEIIPAQNDTFDIVFNNFIVSTTATQDYGQSGCRLAIPVQVPEGKRISLDSVSIAGVTVVPQGGRSTASITHSFKGRESARIETFVETESFAVTHAQELNAGYSECGSGVALLGTRIDMSASRASWQAENTVVSLSGGSGKLVYQLEYEDCIPEPQQCRDGEFEINGRCYEKASYCSEYHGLGANVCTNDFDQLSCKWDFSRNLCNSECKSYQFMRDSICYDKATYCFEYSGTNSEVCNNGDDNLTCDWVPSTNSCVSTCPAGTFLMNDQCYELRGKCSQYDNTNNGTCNNNIDDVRCDWLPPNYADSKVASTCAAECPSDAFEINGNCYAKNGTCAQYNNTDSETCNTREDNLLCDWNSDKKQCYRER